MASPHASRSSVLGRVDPRRPIGAALLCAGLLACAGAEPPPAPPAPAAPEPAGAAGAAPSPAAQVFADDGIEYVFADPDRPRKIDATFPTIDALAEAELRDNKLPGLVVGLVVDGELVYGKGFGYVDVEKKTKPDIDTVYRLMSNTKSLEALALLALRDDGALSLEDPITRLVPEAAGLVYPTRDAAPITLRQLLTHTSGLPRTSRFETDVYEREVGEEDVTRFLSGVPLERAPGAAFSYSNLGYRLVSLAVARASHMPMPAFMKQRLLDPLGMTASTFDVAAVPPDRLAPPYVGGTSGPFERASMPRTGMFVGVGGLYSSLRDMARYVAFQLSAYPPRSAPDSGPVRRSTVRESHFNALKGGDDGGDYAYGWFVKDDCEMGGRVVQHSGAIDGYGALWQLLPESGVGFIEATNVHRGGGLGFEVLRALAKAGALAKRVPHGERLAVPFDAVMPRLLAVQNAWDEEAFKAVMTKPVGGRIAAEKEELAGYRASHGACSGYTPIEITSPLAARFAVHCERGALEMQISLNVNDKLVDGFAGISRDVAPPPDLRAAADRITALVGRWDDRVYRKHLAPKAAEPRDATRERFAALGRAHGACKVKSFYRWANYPLFVLGCERGGDLTLSPQLDEKSPAVVASYALREIPPVCAPK